MKTLEQLREYNKLRARKMRSTPEGRDRVNAIAHKAYLKRKDNVEWKTSNNKYYQKKYEENKNAAFMMYGGFECVCNHRTGICGTKDKEFLAIDHIEKRKKWGHSKTFTGRVFYGWLRRMGYPDGFRVLCHNCNHSLGIWGYCPQSDTEKQ